MVHARAEALCSVLTWRTQVWRVQVLLRQAKSPARFQDYTRPSQQTRPSGAWSEGRVDRADAVRVSRMLRPPDARARSIGTAPMAPTMSPISDVVEPGWRQRVAAWRDELWPASELWPLAGQPAARASPPPRGAASFSGVGCGALSCLPCVGFVTLSVLSVSLFFSLLYSVSWPALIASRHTTSPAPVIGQRAQRACRSVHMPAVFLLQRTN